MEVGEDQHLGAPLARTEGPDVKDPARAVHRVSEDVGAVRGEGHTSHRVRVAVWGWEEEDGQEAGDLLISVTTAFLRRSQILMSLSIPAEMT